MILPLDDNQSPLYKQSVATQINRIINWEQYFFSAHALFSLKEHYTKKDVNAAYYQLAMRFHPDKNPDIPEANNAFQVINLAKEFLDYELLSPSEQRQEFNQVANNPFLTTNAKHTFFGTMFNTGFSTPPKEDFNNPSLYKGKGFAAILEVLERGRKAEELQEGLRDFCPFKLPSAAKEQIATLIKQGSTTESINIVDWLNLCRYQDDFELFRQLCDFALCQKYQAPLEQIKNFLPESNTHSDNSVLVNYLFAVIDARTAHFVMSQLSRFIDPQAQDELFDFFKKKHAILASRYDMPYYHVMAAFLGWHSSSSQLITEIREDILKRGGNCCIDATRVHSNISDEAFYLDENLINNFYAPLLCKLPYRKRNHHLSSLISVFKEQGVFTASDALYVGSASLCLDVVSQILSEHPELPINPYYLLYDLIHKDFFNPKDYNNYDFQHLILPNGQKTTWDNAIACITKLFKQIIAHAQLTPEQLTELFLFLLENNNSLETYTLNYILARMDECSLSPALQNKIWRYCLREFTYNWDAAFLDTLAKRAQPLFFDSIPIQDFLFSNIHSKPELITKILRTEPRYLSSRYADMPVMTSFKSYDFFANYKYEDNKYRIGTVSGLYLHHSLTTIRRHCTLKQRKSCAIVEAMEAEDYALFNVALEIPIYKNPKQHDIYQWFYNEPLLRHSRCDAMHIAAIRGLDKELLAMLQKGGDYQQKASIWRKSSYFGIETLILEQKSSYQYAKEQRLPESCRWILQQELKDYIEGRQKEGDYTTRLSICGYTFWNCGYSRADKVYGAKAFLNLLETTDFFDYGQNLEVVNHFAQEYPALTQGRLGSLFANYKTLCHWYEEELKDSFEYSSWMQSKELYADKRGFNDISSNNNYKPTKV